MSAGADLVMGRFQELGGRAKHMAIGADGDMGDLLPYWVQTSLNEGGLKDQHVIKALSLLEDECNSHIENEEWYELPQITENGMRHEEELVYLNERAKKIKEEKALLRHGILIIMATNRWLALIYLLFFPFGVVYMILQSIYQNTQSLLVVLLSLIHKRLGLMLLGPPPKEKGKGK